MSIEKLHDGDGEHRGVKFVYTILESDGKAFSEVNYKLPHGPAVNVAGSVPYPTLQYAIAAVEELAATAINAWLNKATV
jgi:hypothetical protein